MQFSNPSVHKVQGPEAVRELFSALYDPKRGKPDLAYGISNLDVVERQFPEYTISSGNISRLAAGVPSRFIYTSEKGKTYIGSDKLLNRESRYVPLEQLEPIGDITIIGDVTVFMSENRGRVEAYAVTNAAVARQMIGVFNFLWSQGR